MLVIPGREARISVAATLTVQHTNSGEYKVVVSSQFGNAEAKAHLWVQDALIELETEWFFDTFMFAGLNIQGQKGSNYVLRCTSDLRNTNFATWTTLCATTLTSWGWFYLDTESPFVPYRFCGAKLAPQLVPTSGTSHRGAGGHRR